MAVMTDDDRWLARRLPDDFVNRGGDSYSRVSKIVAENWWEYSGRALTELIEMLLPILEPIRSQGGVTDALRSECESTVAAWLASQD